MYISDDETDKLERHFRFWCFEDGRMLPRGLILELVFSSNFPGCIFFAVRGKTWDVVEDSDTLASSNIFLRDFSTAEFLLEWPMALVCVFQ